MPIYKRANIEWAKMAIAGLFFIAATTNAIATHARGHGDKQRQLWPKSHLLNMKRKVVGVANNDDSHNQRHVNTCMNAPTSTNVIHNDLFTLTPLTLQTIIDSGNHGICAIDIVNGSAVTYSPNVDYVGYDQCVYETCSTHSQSSGERSCNEETIVFHVMDCDEELGNKNEDDLHQAEYPLKPVKWMQIVSTPVVVEEEMIRTKTPTMNPSEKPNVSISTTTSPTLPPVSQSPTTKKPVNFNWVINNVNTDTVSPTVSPSSSNKEKDTVHHFFSTPTDTVQHIISTSITHPTPSKKTNYPTRAGDDMDFSDYIAAQQGGSFDPCSGDSRRSRSGRGLRSSSRRSQGCGTTSPGPTVSVVPMTSTAPSSQVRMYILLLIL